MSVPDHELDEPSDQEWCSLHTHYRPCRECRNEVADQQLHIQKEER